MALKIIHTKNLRWVDIVKPSDSDILYLKENFKFHPLDFEDVVTPSIRPKIDEYDDYNFLILLFPLLDRKTMEIKPAEVDFFIGKDFVVTIHDGNMKSLNNLVANVHQHDNTRAVYMTQGSGFLLFSILEILFKRSFPILDRISLEMDSAGKEIFQLNMETLQQLSRIKKNIIVYRRIMKMHKFVLHKLMKKNRSYLLFKDSKIYFQNLIEYAENIWDVLASDKETVESYEETNQSLAAHRMNDILRVLTVGSVIIFLLTLIVTVFMFVESVSSLEETPYILAVVLGSLGLTTALMLLYFRKRNWL